MHPKLSHHQIIIIRGLMSQVVTQTYNLHLISIFVGLAFFFFVFGYCQNLKENQEYRKRDKHVVKAPIPKKDKFDMNEQKTHHKERENVIQTEKTPTHPQQQRITVDYRSATLDNLKRMSYRGRQTSSMIIEQKKDNTHLEWQRRRKFQAPKPPPVSPIKKTTKEDQSKIQQMPKNLYAPTKSVIAEPANKPSTIFQKASRTTSETSLFGKLENLKPKTDVSMNKQSSMSEAPKPEIKPKVEEQEPPAKKQQQKPPSVEPKETVPILLQKSSSQHEPQIPKKVSPINEQSSGGIKQEKQIDPPPQAIKKASTPRQYLEKLIQYGDGFENKVEIKTKINNFVGAKESPEEIWAFTKGYIKTIDTSNKNEVITFSFKIWEFIVQKSIRTTNVKIGFEKIPPREPVSQVYKNQINTYIIIVNLFRVMGHEDVWLGIFSKTLSMLRFLFERNTLIEGLDKDTLSDEDKLDRFDLMKLSFVAKDGQVAIKYLSRVDFLSYFLLCLTTFDPVLFFSEIQEKTGQKYSFMAELKQFQYKWSYNQFWLLINEVKRNPHESYFQLHFWNNVISSIYLQILEHRKNKSFQMFADLEVKIFKMCKTLAKKLNNIKELKLIRNMMIDDEDKRYDFDGDDFVSSIETLGRSMEQREKDMKSRTWEEFRNKNSVIYYLWRL